VATALETAKVPFKREADYSALSGVVYDFRSDFVVPEAERPRAFIEVRKSSSRHASLYAKDKCSPRLIERPTPEMLRDFDCGWPMDRNNTANNGHGV